MLCYKIVRILNGGHRTPALCRYLRPRQYKPFAQNMYSTHAGVNHLVSPLKLVVLYALHFPIPRHKLLHAVFPGHAQKKTRGRINQEARASSGRGGGQRERGIENRQRQRRRRASWPEGWKGRPSRCEWALTAHWTKEKGVCSTSLFLPLSAVNRCMPTAVAAIRLGFSKSNRLSGRTRSEKKKT